MDTQGKDKPVVISAENYAKKTVFKFSFVNPKILGLLTVLLLLVGGVGAGVYLTQAPNQTLTQATLTTAEISFKPGAIQTETGSGFNIDVFGNANGNQITGVKLAFKYDPDVLELKSITPKQFLPKILLAPVIASDSAAVSLGTDGNSGISGSGILATLSFQVKTQQATSTQISFEKDKTQVNVLGNTDNLVGNLDSAKITITPGSPSPPVIPESSASAKVQDITRIEETLQPSSQSAALVSEFDFNSDDRINSVDLSVLYSAWGTPETEIQKKADINGDGVVNGLDYARFLPQLQR